MAPCIGVEFQLEVGSTVAVMRWRNHDDQSAPYGNEGPGAGLVLPIVSFAYTLFLAIVVETTGFTYHLRAGPHID